MITMSFSRCRRSWRLFHSTEASPFQSETGGFLEKTMPELTQHEQESAMRESGNEVTLKRMALQQLRRYSMNNVSMRTTGMNMGHTACKPEGEKTSTRAFWVKLSATGMTERQQTRCVFQQPAQSLQNSAASNLERCARTFTKQTLSIQNNNVGVPQRTVRKLCPVFLNSEYTLL